MNEWFGSDQNDPDPFIIITDAYNNIFTLENTM